jgi:hypothetical protein
MDTNPAPYQPPRVVEAGAWRHPLPGETTAQYQDRLSHSCYRCGVHIRDMDALDAHEQACTG